MNGKRADHGDQIPGEQFDPELAALFSEANETPLEADAFTRAVLRQIEQERRRRVMYQVGGTIAALSAGAFAAPFVGKTTFDAVVWLTQGTPPAAAMFTTPAAYALAAVITWRIARRGFR